MLTTDDRLRRLERDWKTTGEISDLIAYRSALKQSCSSAGLELSVDAPIEVLSVNLLSDGIDQIRKGEYPLQPFHNGIYRPFTFEENCRARLKQPDLFYVFLDSCTVIAYKKNSSMFKIIQISDDIIRLPKGDKQKFLPCDYDAIKVEDGVVELNSQNALYNERLTEAQALTHEGWAKLIPNKNTRENYIKQTYKLIREQYPIENNHWRYNNASELIAMAFYILRNLKQDQMRALFVNSLSNNSLANGSYNLISNGRLARVALK